MKKVEEMRAEYRREDLGKGVRGKHYEEFSAHSRVAKGGLQSARQDRGI